MANEKWSVYCWSSDWRMATSYKFVILWGKMLTNRIMIATLRFNWFFNDFQRKKNKSKSFRQWNYSARAIHNYQVFKFWPNEWVVSQSSSSMNCSRCIYVKSFSPWMALSHSLWIYSKHYHRITLPPLNVSIRNNSH